MGIIGRIIGAANANATTGVQKTNSLDKTEAISFKNANKVGMSAPNALNPSTMNFLAQLDGKITADMADDLLATPYVSLDFNG